jgi:hypothetical protein
MAPRPWAVSSPAARAQRHGAAAASSLSNRRSLTALLFCIAFACAAILLISRSGQGEPASSSSSSSSSRKSARQPVADGGRATSSGIDAGVAARIAEGRRRRRREGHDSLQQAAAASAGGGGIGGGGRRARPATDTDDSAQACSAWLEDSQQQRLPDLGFDYPELRALKQRLRRALGCSSGCPLQAVRRAYAAALGEALGALSSWSIGGGYAAGPGGLLTSAQDEADAPLPSSCPAAALREVAAFARDALAALLLVDAAAAEEPAAATRPAAGPLPPAALEQLAPCPAFDPSLPPFPRGQRLLLAANLRDAGRSAPSAAVQAVRLALALPPGALAVGMHEGRSSDRTPFALSVLRLMLLPLRVPQNVTVGGRADPPRQQQRGAGATAAEMPRIERMAALRNAALAPWLGPWRRRREEEEDGGAAALALGVLPLSVRDDKEEEVQPPLPPLARPDVVAFANDAFFCAEDVLRLAAHRAPIACGFDFYSAPWQVAAATQAEQRRRRRNDGGGGGAGAGAAAEEGASARAADGGKSQQARRHDREDDDNGGLEDPSVRRDYEEDYADEELQTGEGEGGATADAAATGPTRPAATITKPLPPGRGAARFYDKWVSRDRLGVRLSNRPPYVRDEASARRLAQGLPVAAVCCWNGLAVLDARPMWGGSSSSQRQQPVVFRAGGDPRDCPDSSECSLLCDDYRRAVAAQAAAEAPPAAYRAVLDPAVRLAYDPAQSRALFFGSESDATDAHPAIPGFDVAPVDRALGPRRPWGEVVVASASTAKEDDPGSAATVSTAAVTPQSIDCCSLRSGKNFVRFRSDCKPLKV